MAKLVVCSLRQAVKQSSAHSHTRANNRLVRQIKSKVFGLSQPSDQILIRIHIYTYILEYGVCDRMCWHWCRLPVQSEKKTVNELYTNMTPNCMWLKTKDLCPSFRTFNIKYSIYIGDLNHRLLISYILEFLNMIWISFQVWKIYSVRYLFSSMSYCDVYPWDHLNYICWHNFWLNVFL